MLGPTLPGFLKTEETLDRFLGAFFDHTLPKGEWTHAAHVSLAADLLFTADIDGVLPRVRHSIRTFNEAVGGQNTATAGYHETLTVFWLKVVSHKLAEFEAPTRLEAVRAVVAAYGEARTLHAQYYSTDIVADQVARQVWVAPDLLPL